MPSRMKTIGRYGNGVGALFFAFLALYALMQGAVIVTLFWLLVAGLAAFNLYVVEKVAVLTSDEDRLVSGIVGNTPETVVHHHGS